MFTVNGSFSIQPTDNGRIIMPIAYPIGYPPNELTNASERLLRLESI
jgi:hypothetical protein